MKKHKFILQKNVHNRIHVIDRNTDVNLIEFVTDREEHDL